MKMNKINDLAQTATTVTELFEAFKSFINRSGNSDQEVSEKLLTRVEDLMLVLVGLSQAESITTAIVMTLQFARSYYDKSFVNLLAKFFDQMRVSPQPGEQPQPLSQELKKSIWTGLKKQSGDGCILNSLRETSLRERMHALRNTDLVHMLRHCINALVIIGFMPDKAESILTTSVYDFVDLKVSRKSSMDFLDSTFYCIDWVINCLIPAYEANDWSLLTGKDEISDMSRDFVKAKDSVDLMMQGRMDLVKAKYDFTTEADVLFFVEDLAIKYSLYLSSMKKDKSSMHYDVVTKRIVSLNKLAGDIYSTLKETPLREKPFGVLIHGDSGVSKSTLLNIINSQLCAANEFRLDNNSVVYLNSEEKFHSAYRTWHVTFVFDDVGNTRPERTQENPLLQFVQFLNTMHFCALSPEADKKGKMQVLPKLGFVTSNKKDLNAAYYSINPTSVLRRFEYHIGAKLRPEAINADTGMLKEEYVHHPCPDVWLLTLEHIRIVRMGGSIPDVCLYVKDMEDASLYDVLDFLVERSKEHFAMQKNLVARQTELFTAERCAAHHYPASCCPRCDSGCAFIGKQAGMGDFVNSTRQAVKGAYMRTKSQFVQPSFDDAGFLPLEIYRTEFDECDRTTLTPRERIREVCRAAAGIMERHQPQHPLTTLAGVGAALVAVYALFKKGAQLLSDTAKLEMQRAIEPFAEGVQQDFWRKPVVVDHEIPEASATTPLQDFESKLWKNLAVVNIKTPDDEFNVYGLPVGGCDWVVPFHAIEDAAHCDVLLTVSQERGHGQVGHKKFSQYICVDQFQQIPKTDLAVIRLVAGGSVADFTKFVQLTPGSGHSKLYFRDLGLVEHARPVKVWLATLQDYGIGYTQPGYRYSTDFVTFRGLCGAVLVSNGKSPRILGMHVAGVGNNGAAAILTSHQIMAAKSRIKASGIHSSAPMPTEEYGFRYNLRPDIHFKNPVHYLPKDKEYNLQVHGQTDLPAVRFRSSVAASPISSLVTEVLEKPRVHTRPPTHQDYLHYQRDLDIMGEVRKPLRASVLARALSDMKTQFDRFYDNHPEFGQAVGFLDYEQSINGIRGAIGIDHINLNTSVANPLRGPKKKYVSVMHDGEEYHIEFDPERLDVRRRYDEIVADLAAGKRVNAQFAVFLKDEPVTFKKFDDHKVRTIGACQIAFTLVARSYFLSLMAARRRFPLQFESAVGCNAAGKDWRCFAESLRDHSRIINGDYKGFDKRLHAEVTNAVFDYYDHIFAKIGMDLKFRTVARGIGTEICNPIYEVKGVLISVSGSNPSGQPLTVEVNNDANRLYMRYAYYTLHSDPQSLCCDVPPFADKIDLLCYGDDNIASVDPSESKFNHTSAANVLATIGVQYTMADKESESVPFIRLDDADLLKRKFRLHEDLGCVVGPIEEDSILKSLHMWRTDSPLCEGEYMAGVLRQALDEWFLHGPEVYKVRRQQVCEIASKHKCYPPITDFLSLPSYEDLCDRYHQTTSVMEEFSQSVPPARATKFVKQSGLSVFELEYLDGDCGPETFVNHLVIGDYCALLSGFVMVAVYSFIYLRFDVSVDWRGFKIPWLMLFCPPSQIISMLIFAKSAVSYFKAFDTLFRALTGSQKHQKHVVARSGRRYVHSKVVETRLDWNSYCRVLRKRRLCKQAGLEDFPASSSSALKKELVQYFLIHRRARQDHWTRLRAVHSELLAHFKAKRCHVLDMSVVFEELHMLAYNEGQVIVVPCPSLVHGMYWEDRIKARERTYKRCQQMLRAWITLKLYDSPLYDLLGRDEYFRVLSYGAPVFEPVSPCDYFRSGGFGKQAVKFKNELEGLSFLLPETRLSWSRLENIAQNNNEQSSREDSRSKLPPGSVPDTQKQEVMEFTIQAGTETPSLSFPTPDSGADINVGQVGGNDNSQAIGGFDDFNETVQITTSNPDQSFDMATTETASFDQWFRRPTPIYEENWDVNSPFAATLFPWDLWAKQPRVANRLTNYKNFRGNLHIKIMLNGNGFYWGRLLASYDPWLTFYGAGVFIPVEASQKPHLWLDPTTNSGGEMVLPFVHEFNAVDMTISGAFQQMGTLQLSSVVDLAHATSTRPVGVTVWAWCEDVVLSAPCQRNIDGLVAQAGRDEFGSGPVSRPASLVASMAGKLSKVPGIGPYALATQTAASAVGKIAAMFGYSRPVVIAEPCLNSPLPAGNLATVDAPDTSRTFALTAKQEVVVDPRTVGLNSVDEMSLSYLCAKESYLTQFNWTYTDATNALLFNCGVSPMMNTVITGTTGEGYDLTPMAFAAHPFRYWCGSVTFRFQIVASNFHKGRLMFTWDPVAGEGTGVLPITKYNHIVDIGEQKDFEIVVGWGSDQPALEIPALSDVKYSTLLQVWDNDQYNGVLSVYVLNELVTAQDTTVPATIVVSVKSNEMNLYAPQEERLNNISYIPNPGEAILVAQSGPGIKLDDENQPGSNAFMPECDNVVATFGNVGMSKAQLGFCVGEDVPSFRSCVKRYSQHAILGSQVLNNEGQSMFIHKQPAFPYMYGYDTLGVDRDGATPCNRCTFTLLNYLSGGYVGWRGSMRWKLVPLLAPCCSWMAEARRCGSNCNYEDNWVDYSLPAQKNPISFARSIRQAYQADMNGGWDGIVTTSTQHNPVLEFAIPYYNTKRFLVIPEHTATDSSEGMGWWFRYIVNADQNGVNTSVQRAAIFNTYVAAGDDFSFYFFKGVPRIYESSI